MTEYRRILLDDRPVQVHVEDQELVTADGRRISIEAAQHLPPVEPTKVIATHLTYRSRVEEFMTRLPAAPTYFQKPTTSLNAHRGDVVRPQRCKYLNFEGEIAIVIGQTAFDISVDEAAEHIAGYTIANDFGLHDFRDTDAGSMLRVKGSDTLCPLGPGLIDDWDFYHKEIRTLVNGEVRQSGNTSEMEWDMHYLVADLARTITLLPGDVILSGTPAGSRPVEPGDEITVEVEGLGALTNRIVSGEVAVRTDVGAQPSESEEVVSTALGGDWEFRGVRAPQGPGAKHYESEVRE
jgi:5-oxopent-3-ene-1,2,5-tricarboxylate decarboxylase/2-hydroxyhepta-2,4-diene-1,7-dioate isomerase